MKINTTKFIEGLLQIAVLGIILSLVFQHAHMKEEINNTEQRIELQFSDTEMAILQTKSDLDSIGIQLDRMIEKLDSINLKK